MRDFVGYVRGHLARADVPVDRYDDIVEELASELEARYTALVQRGSTDDAAWALRRQAHGPVADAPGHSDADLPWRYSRAPSRRDVPLVLT